MNVLKKIGGKEIRQHMILKIFWKRIFFWSKNQKREEKLDWKIQFDQIVFTLSLSVYTETAAVHARVHARTKKKKNTFFVVVVDFILT